MDHLEKIVKIIFPQSHEARNTAIQLEGGKFKTYWKKKLFAWKIIRFLNSLPQEIADV